MRWQMMLQMTVGLGALYGLGNHALQKGLAPLIEQQAAVGAKGQAEIAQALGALAFQKELTAARTLVVSLAESPVLGGIGRQFKKPELRVSALKKALQGAQAQAGKDAQVALLNAKGAPLIETALSAQLAQSKAAQAALKNTAYVEVNVLGKRPHFISAAPISQGGRQLGVLLLAHPIDGPMLHSWVPQEEQQALALRLQGTVVTSRRGMEVPTQGDVALVSVGNRAFTPYLGPIFDDGGTCGELVALGAFDLPAQSFLAQKFQMAMIILGATSWLIMALVILIGGRASAAPAKETDAAKASDKLEAVAPAEQAFVINTKKQTSTPLEKTPAPASGPAETPISSHFVPVENAANGVGDQAEKLLEAASRPPSTPPVAPPSMPFSVPPAVPPSPPTPAPSSAIGLPPATLPPAKAAPGGSPTLPPLGAPGPGEGNIKDLPVPLEQQDWPAASSMPPVPPPAASTVSPPSFAHSPAVPTSGLGASSDVFSAPPAAVPPPTVPPPSPAPEVGGAQASFDAIAAAALSVPPPPAAVSNGPTSNVSAENLPIPKDGLSPAMLVGQQIAQQHPGASLASPSQTHQEDLPMPKSGLSPAVAAEQLSPAMPSVPPPGMGGLPPMPNAGLAPGASPLGPGPANPWQNASASPEQASPLGSPGLGLGSGSLPPMGLGATQNPATMPPATGNIGMPGQQLRPYDPQHYQQVFHEFVAAKTRLGERVDGLTLEGFGAKLRASEENLIGRHACRAVRFQVLVKDQTVSLRPQLVR